MYQNPFTLITSNSYSMFLTIMHYKPKKMNLDPFVFDKKMSKFSKSLKKSNFDKNILLK